MEDSPENRHTPPPPPPGAQLVTRFSPPRARRSFRLVGGSFRRGVEKLGDIEPFEGAFLNANEDSSIESVEMKILESKMQILPLRMMVSKAWVKHTPPS